jgi:hypothetical protein
MRTLKADLLDRRSICCHSIIRDSGSRHEGCRDCGEGATKGQTWQVGNGDRTLVVDVWLHRVDEDASGLTFEEWDPSEDTDASESPVTLIVNSSELRATGFDLREVIPLQLETVARGGPGTSGAALKQIHGMGTRRYVLSVDNDNEFRSRCE